MVVLSSRKGWRMFLNLVIMVVLWRNALACAAIYATLTTIKNENIVEQNGRKRNLFQKETGISDG